MQNLKTGILNRNQLKIIAIIAMLIDHVAWAWFPSTEPLGYIMHLFGRITAPCMCFFIAQGFEYTRNRFKYGIRLGIFALVSWIPFRFFETGRLPFGFENGEFFCDILSQSMIFTLFLAYIALCILESKINPILQIIAVCALCILDMKSDWHVTGIIMTIVFYFFNKDKKSQVIAFSATAILIFIYKMIGFGSNWVSHSFQAGLLLFVPLLIMYNGKKGSSKPFFKWFFYIFYPLHLIILAILRYYVII
jgi:hypothetical protein